MRKVFISALALLTAAAVLSCASPNSAPLVEVELEGAAGSAPSVRSNNTVARAGNAGLDELGGSGGARPAPRPPLSEGGAGGAPPAPELPKGPPLTYDLSNLPAACSTDLVPTYLGCVACHEADQSASDDLTRLEAVRNEEMLSCSDDADCTSAGTFLGCNGGCTVAINKASVDRYSQSIDNMKEALCAGHQVLSECPIFQAQCLPTMPKCVSGSCRLEEIPWEPQL